MFQQFDILLLALAVFSATAFIWLKSRGYTLAIKKALNVLWHAFAPLEFKNDTPVRLTKPVMLATVSAQVTAWEPVQTPYRPQTSLSPNDQMGRLSQIVGTAIDTARVAARLHRAAHEQVDAAHYALQNLLDELSDIMPMTTLQPARPAIVASTRSTLRPVYKTALAA